MPSEGPKVNLKNVVRTTSFVEQHQQSSLPQIDLDISELNELLEVDIDMSSIELEDNDPLAIEPEATVHLEEDIEEPYDEEDILEDMDGLDELDTDLDTLAIASNRGIEHKGTPKSYQARSSQKEKLMALKRYGGSTSVVNAVDLALSWLAKQQGRDGHWPHIPPPPLPEKKDQKRKGDVQKEKHNRATGDDKKKRPKKTNHTNLEAITASALLAFLGAGHTEHRGEHKTQVRKGISYLNKSIGQILSKQKLNQKSKSKSKRSKPNTPLLRNHYSTAIVLMALCESAIFGSSASTRRHADLLSQSLIDCYDGEGWSYLGSGDDFSVSGWVALGLKSAMQAQLPSVKDHKRISEIYREYSLWVNTMVNSTTGLAKYRSNKPGSLALTWVGMFQKQFLGFPQSDPFLQKGSELGIDHVSSYMTKNKMGQFVWRNIYAIYYGTLAAFQQQGPFWNKWNPIMKQVLTETQIRDPQSPLRGSWTPQHDNTGSRGGRIMTTALMTLCLEVYYRYALIKK